MSTIHLHASIQRFADNYEVVRLPGNCTLLQLLEQLISDFPRLKPIIFSTDKKVSPYLIIFINGEDSRSLSEDALIPADANIEIITSLVGG